MKFYANKTNEKWMALAIELAKKGLGKTSPNPLVGAVIVKNGKLLARGFHAQAGKDHAEIVALKKLSREKLKGSTLFVTMEPCCFHGKTPPCVTQIIKSGIRKVVVGCRDTNPRVNGWGIRLLKRAGIQVAEGVLQEACESLNRPFRKWIKQKIPFVTLKVASTLDGKIATASGDSKWITNLESRKRVHELRSQVDAILIGVGTLKQDDPLLSVRYGNAKGNENPMVVVVDEKLNSFPEAKIFRVKNRKIIFATTDSAPKKRREEFEKKGASVWVLPKDLQGFVDLKSLLKRLGKEGILHLFVEGGASIFSSFLAKRLADHLILLMAPKLLGKGAKSWTPPFGFKKVEEGLQLQNIAIQVLGSDCMIEGDFVGP